jgi:uncharacterized phage protein (TIGR02218 family)
MRAIDPELQARLDAGATKMCRCWQVSRRDGNTYGFTDHDRDITFSGTVFRASSGMDASALQTATGLSVDNAQAAGALSDAAVTEEDIRRGKFDRAGIDHWLVDWERPDLRVLLFRGHFGEIRRADGSFEVELRGLAEALNVPVGRSILRGCDRVLGDGKCGFDQSQSDFFAETQADDGSSISQVISSGLNGYSDGWFSDGKLTWLTGENTGDVFAVKVDLASGGGRRVLHLWQQPARPVVAGDRFHVVAGCDKRAATCQSKFDNFVNFRGFPHIPGEDWVTAYPKNGAVHDGASQNRG